MVHKTHVLFSESKTLMIFLKWLPILINKPNLFTAFKNIKNLHCDTNTAIFFIFRLQTIDSRSRSPPTLFACTMAATERWLSWDTARRAPIRRRPGMSTWRRLVVSVSCARRLTQAARGWGTGRRDRPSVSAALSKNWNTFLNVVPLLIMYEYVVVQINFIVFLCVACLFADLTLEVIQGKKYYIIYLYIKF